MRFDRGLLALCALGVGGCEAPHEDDCTWVEGPLGTVTAGLQVGQAGGCSTAIVRGLAQQLIDEVNCIRPGTLVDFSDLRLDAEASVWPYLQAPAVAGLRRAVEARGGRFPISSALRTLPQQYLLYKWWQDSQCGIQIAAQPGSSPHERGLAVDTPGWEAWRGALEAEGFDWYGNGDRVHYDWEGGGRVVDLGGLSVLAFQRLWNRNHPGDRIAEDGAYGPQTAGKLRVSPAEGFDVGGCEPEPPDPPPDPPTDPPTDPPMEPEVDAAVEPPVTLDASVPDAEPEPEPSPDEDAHLDDAPDAEVIDEPDVPPDDAPAPPTKAVSGARVTGLRSTGEASCAARPGLPTGGLALWGLALAGLVTRRGRKRAG